MAFFEEDLPKPNTRRLYAENAPEWKIMVGGIIASLVTGASMPVYAVLFGEVLGVLAKPVEDGRDDSVLYAWLFVGTGVIVGTAYFFQVCSFLERSIGPMNVPIL